MVCQCCINFTKYFLFLFNLLFFFLGLLLLSVGLWIVVDKTSILRFAPSSMSLSLPSYFLAICGSITMLVCFFGCLGALKEVKCMLGLYFFLLTILMASEIACSILFMTQATMFEAKLEDQVLQLIRSFGHNESSLRDFEKTLEFIQKESHCCGWNGPSDWTDSKIPCTCFNSTNSTTQIQFTCGCVSKLSSSNETHCQVYPQGCKQSIMKWLNENKAIILSILIGVVVVEFIQCVCLSVFCFSHHSQHRPKTHDILFQASRSLCV